MRPAVRDAAVHFAYDGSLNGDWVAHYAVRFARSTPARRLHLLHVRGAVPEAMLAARLARLADECSLFGVALDCEAFADEGGEVAGQLLARVPEDPRHLLLGGTRWRPRHGTYLAHTVTAQLLARGRCTVVGLRVVNPGVLGQPGRLLLPLDASQPRLAATLPLVAALAPDLRELQLLVLREIQPLRLRLLGTRAAGSLLAADRLLAAALEDELRRSFDFADCHLDATAALCDDRAGEILGAARRLRARLIAVEAGHSDAGPGSKAALECVLAGPPCDVAVFGSGA